MTRIAILYGSTYGNTEAAAGAIAHALASTASCEPRLHEIGTVDLRALEPFDVLIVGCSTWHIGRLQDDWSSKADDLDALDLRGRSVALFGTGDQVAYGDTFVDALGILADELEARGAELIAPWPAVGYEHTASRAQRGPTFVGLALDDDNQSASTPGRIARWVAQLVHSLGLRPPTPGLAAHSDGSTAGG
jgi:flavodoxin I